MKGEVEETRTFAEDSSMTGLGTGNGGMETLGDVAFCATARHVVDWSDSDTIYGVRNGYRTCVRRKRGGNGTFLSCFILQSVPKRYIHM